MKKHIINALSGIVIAGIFLFLTLRNKPLDEIFALIKEARFNWILLSIAMLIIVFMLRSLRWKLLLNNTGTHPSFKDVAYSYLLGVFVNSFTPKLGEVIRCTSMKKSSGIETSKSLGTVISERIYDLLALISGIIIILFLESERLGSLVADAFRGLFISIGDNVLSIVLYSAGGVALLFLIWFLTKKIGFGAKVKDFIKGIVSSARMTFRIKNSRNFALQTVLIWAVMVIMNFAVLKSLPSTDSLSLYFAMVSLFIGTIGWAIPTPGGIGSSHFFILQLFILFNLNEETGIAYAVLVNGLQVVFTILAGFMAVALVTIIRLVNKNKVKTQNT